MRYVFVGFDLRLSQFLWFADVTEKSRKPREQISGHHDIIIERVMYEYQMNINELWKSNWKSCEWIFTNYEGALLLCLIIIK